MPLLDCAVVKKLTPDIVFRRSARLFEDAASEFHDHRLATPAGRVSQRIRQRETDRAPFPPVDVGGGAASFRDRRPHATTPASAA